MKTHRSFRSVLAIVSLICGLWASTALATPIDYIFDGQMIGVGDVLFADGITTAALDTAPIKITLSGDTANVISSSGINYIEGLTGSIIVNATGLFDDNGDPMGIYTALFEDEMRVYYNGLIDAIGFGTASAAADGGVDLMEWYGIGPFDLLSPLPLILTDLSWSAFDVTFTQGPFANLIIDEVAPVPEPSTFALIGLGLAGLGLTRRLRSRKQD